MINTSASETASTTALRRSRATGLQVVALASGLPPYIESRFQASSSAHSERADASAAHANLEFEGHVGEHFGEIALQALREQTCRQTCSHAISHTHVMAQTTLMTLSAETRALIAVAPYFARTCYRAPPPPPLPDTLECDSVVGVVDV